MRGIPHLKSRWKMPKCWNDVESPHHFNIFFWECSTPTSWAQNKPKKRTICTCTTDARPPSSIGKPYSRQAVNSLYKTMIVTSRGNELLGNPGYPSHPNMRSCKCTEYCIWMGVYSRLPSISRHVTSLLLPRGGGVIRKVPSPQRWWQTINLTCRGGSNNQYSHSVHHTSIANQVTLL